MHDQPIDNHSSVNERLLNPSHYNAKANYTKEDYPYLHRELARKNHSKDKAGTSEQEKTSNNTLDQIPLVSFSLRASFINGMESLSIISDERQSKSRAEFYFANNSSCKQRIIDQLLSESSPLFYVRSLDDFEKHGLMQQVWLENGKLYKEEGRLFLDHPLTLVFDLTTMTAGDIASFNDILQDKPKCNDKPLGDHVIRVFLVNDAMLQGEQISNPDLWRRLGLMPQKEIPAANCITDSITDEVLLEQKITEEIPACKSQKIIDFSDCCEWYLLLFGGITPDENGLFIFSEGALANLDDDIHLVLKNAPWNSSGFKEELAWVLRTGEFEANRKRVMLPDNITLSRADVSTIELDNLKNKMLKDHSMFNAQEVFVCINSSSIDNLQGNMRIEGSRLVKVDMLAALLNSSKQLVVTSNLEEDQWLWLLAKLDKLPEYERPSLFSNLPPVLLLSAKAKCVHQAEDLKSFYKDSELNNSFVYNINPKDTLESLQQVNLKSHNDFTFSLTSSSILKTLLSDTPVILGGLECNPTLAASLETLLLPYPYLFLHGNKVDLPNAKVPLIRPAQEKTTGSSLINHLLSTSYVSHREPPSENKVPRSFQENYTNTPPKNPVYSLLELLPLFYQKSHTNTAPLSYDTFEYQFDRQVKAEQQSDGSDKLTAYHKRHALHILCAKLYRDNSTVYSYIKAKIAQHYPDEVTDHRSDRPALQQWLAKHPIIDMKCIEKDFWILARHCPVDVHASINNIDEIDKVSLKKLATHLVSLVSGSGQTTLARKLKVNLQLAKRHLFFDGVMRSTLRDALIVNKALLKPDTVISKTVALLEKKIVPIIARSLIDEQKEKQIKEILVSYFQGGELPYGYQDLPTALLNHQRHTRARQQRRLSRLADQIQLNPIVFLQGEAGVGKTFMAKAVANKAGYSGCKVIQLDPNQTSEGLFGEQQLKSYSVDNNTDHCSEFHKGPLLEWASSDNPELLLLDEANLASEGLLSPLVGLLRKRPELHYQGNKYPLTEKHRIIMTGNPEHYAGRHLDKALQSRIPILFYSPLQDGVLADSIILPNLPNWSSGQKQQACDRIITLFNCFKELVPGDLVTPRDIKDVLATVHQILRYYSDRLENLTKEHINALIRRAFMDSLAGAVTEDYQQRLNSLNWWYQGRYPEDQSVMTNMDQAFDVFVRQLQAANPDAYFSPAPIRQLVYHYWQSLDKGDGGRVALLIEGPTGRGKDFVLDKTIRLWQRQQALKLLPVRSFIHINANPNQWTAQAEDIEQGRIKKKVIAISEINLIPCPYMEKLFNKVLTGHIKQGFRLFATINPRSFEGREALSPALKSRCTQVKLGALSQLETEGLVQRVPGMSEKLSKWLAGYFHQLSTALDNQKSPVRLALSDLLNTAKYLVNKDSDQWQDAFRQQLALPFLALKTQLPSLEEDRERFALKCARKQHRLTCDKAINLLPGLQAPITVRFGSLPSIGDREVTVNLNTVVEQVILDVKFALQNGKVNNDKRSLVKQASTDEKRLSNKCVFSDVKITPHYEFTRYFPAEPYHFHNYRLSLEEIHFSEDGQLRCCPIDWRNSGPIVDVAGWPDSIDYRIDVEADELPGQVVLTLNNQWQSLPSLTPADKLRAIRCRPETDIQLARCQTTGLLLIKQQEPTSMDMEVTIDFIIAPEQTYFTRLTQEDSLIIQEDLCSKSLKTLLDKNIFNASGDICDAYQELRIIHQIYAIPQRLNALMDWLRTFSFDENITGEGDDRLLNIFKKKQGACMRKSIIFQMLCRYWGLPARQVCNVGHVFVEVSPDAGDTWREYQLGGGGQYTESITEHNWDEYNHQLASSKLRLPTNRVSFAEYDNDNITTLAHKKLLSEIKKTFVESQPLSNAMLESLKACFEQTLSEIEEDRKYFIYQLFSDIYYFFAKKDDYIDCLCHLCEINDYVKHNALGFVQNFIKHHYVDKNHTHRIQRIISALPSFINNMEIKQSKEYLTHTTHLVHSLPKSKYLKGKISHVNINKTYTRVPKANSQFSVEKMVSGLPAFVNHSILKERKSVIIDLHDIGAGLLRQRNEEYVNNNINKKNKLFNLIVKNKSDQSVSTTAMLYAFFIWLASNKPKDDSIWRWLVMEYYICCEQISPMEIPYIYFQEAGCYSTEFTSEMIKIKMKQPSAVILKEKDLLIMFDEFSDEISKHTIEEHLL